jgi:predicted nucleic acid-binding protein
MTGGPQVVLTVGVLSTLASDFEAFFMLELGHEQFELACDLGFTLRRGGVTVPATDLIIAASAITAQAADLEARHFARKRKRLDEAR